MGSESATVSSDTRTPSLSGKLALAGMAMLFAFFLGEIVVRLFVADEVPVRFEQASKIMAEGHRIESRVFDSNPETFWRFKPGLTLDDGNKLLRGVISNGQGFREDHEIAETKAPDEIRILFLGDSSTFGIYLEHEQTYVHQVEERLAQRFPQYKIECINGGVPAYTFFQHWRFLMSDGFDYEPDLIVLYGGWNDAGSADGLGDFEHWRAFQAAQPWPMFRWSRLARLAGTTLSRSAAPEGTADRPRLYPDEFQAVLREIDTAAAERETDLIFLVGGGRFNIDPNAPPQSRAPLQIEQYSYANVRLQEGPHGYVGAIDCVPILQAMARTHSPAEIFIDNIHPTPLTNQRIADKVAADLALWIEARSALW